MTTQSQAPSRAQTQGPSPISTSPPAIAWRERSYYSPDRTVLTAQALQIPGLAMLGRHHMSAAIAPLPDHYHPKCYELTFVIEGTLSFTVLDASQAPKSYTLHRGDLFITCPDEVHSTNRQPLAKGDILWFQIDPSADNLLFLGTDATSDLRQRLEQISAQRIIKLPRQLLRWLEHERPTTSNAYALANMITYLLHQAHAHLAATEPPIPPDIAAVRAAIEQMLKENSASEISLDVLARVAHLSVSQLKQKFKVHMGMPPRHYINRQRIESAKAELLMGLSVTEVAMNHGFSSSSYFVVAFKRFTAMTPSEYVKHKAHTLPDYLQQEPDF